MRNEFRAYAPLLCVVLVAMGCGGTTPVANTALNAVEETPVTAAPITQSVNAVVSGDLLASMPVAVTSFGAASTDTHLYVLGGYFGTPHQYSREFQSNTLSRLPLDGSGAWEEVATIEGGVQGLALVAHQGRLCRFGGNRIMNAEGEPADLRSIAEAACFDPATSTWTVLPDLPVARSSHEAALIGDTVYIAGGWRMDGGPQTSEWANDVLALDLSDPTEWRSIEVPFTRRGVGVTELGAHVVVVGGLTPERDVSSRVDVYNTETEQWSQGPDFPGNIIAAAFGVAAVTVGDAVYASGREGIIYRWRAGEEAWTRTGALAFGRFFHQLAPRSANELIAVGGIGGMHTNGRTRIVEVAVLEREGPRVSTMRIPFPGNSRNRQGVVADRENIYLFGGNNSLGQHDFEPDNFLAEGWRMFLPALRWTEGPAYPQRRQTMQVTSVESRVFSVGGFGHNGTAAVTHPEAYALQGDQWVARGSLPRGRTQFGLVAYGDHLWAFGGLNFDMSRGRNAFDHMTDIQIAPIADAEAPFEPIEAVMPGPRRHFAGAVHEGRYYIFGGMRESFQIVDTCTSFEFESRTFSDAPCPRSPRLGGQLVAYQGRLYLAGGSVRGESGIDVDRSVEVFDPASGEWSVLIEDLPFVTRHTRMVLAGERLMLLTTHNEEGELVIGLIQP